MALDHHWRQPKEKSNQSKLEKLPEAARKKLLVMATAILMLAIISLWLTALVFSLKPKTAQPTNQANQNWQLIQTDFNNFIEVSQKTFGQMKNQINQLINLTATSSGQNLENKTTTTVEIAPEDLEKLKEKLLEKQQE